MNHQQRSDNTISSATYKRCAGILLLSAAFALRKEKNQQKKKLAQRSLQYNDYFKKRKTFGQVPILKNLSDNQFVTYTRMDRETFNYLIKLIKPFALCNENAIQLEERLGLTLRFLASGNSYTDLSFLTAISPSSIARIVLEICHAINKGLKNIIKLPTDEREWKIESEQFNERWNFPHCLGAIDGKHIRIKKPLESGDMYLNYKGFHSIVLMAIANANKEFLLVDIGTNGRVGDASLIGNTQFYSDLVNKKLKIPPPENLKNSTIKASYVFLGDSALALKENLIKPYPYYSIDKNEIAFNYRLSRARVVVENAFGILTNRFRIFNTTINLSPEKAKIITMSCCKLHNFLQQRKINACSSDEVHTDVELSNFTANAVADTVCGNATENRNNFKKYFNTIDIFPH